MKLSGREMVELGHQIGDALLKLTSGSQTERSRVIRNVISVAYRQLIRAGLSPEEIIDLEMSIIDGIHQEISKDLIHKKKHPNLKIVTPPANPRGF